MLIEKPSGPQVIQNRQSDGIAFDGVVGVMMIDLKVFRIGNQAKSPLSGQPLKLEDSPPHTQRHRCTAGGHKSDSFESKSDFVQYDLILTLVRDFHHH